MNFERPESVLLELGEQEFKLWQHSPITAAYLQFMEDFITASRDLAADLLEAGAYRLGDNHEDRNPDVVRGKLIATRYLRGIGLSEIQAFYGKEPAVEAKSE